MFVTDDKCKCSDELIQLLDKQIAIQGGYFLHSNIYGIKKNFSQRNFDTLLTYKQILLKGKCCIDKTLYNKILEKIKTKI